MKKRILSLLACIILLVLCLVSCGDVEFKVEFVVDGEVYDTISTSGYETVKMPTNPTKDGYTFGGWYWDNDTWQKPFTANSLLDAPLSSDMSVYAKWNCNHPALTDWITDTEPTCKDAGEKHKACTVCGAKIETDTIEKTNVHTVVTDAAVPPTETTDGLTEGSHCSVCGTVITAQTVVPNLSHGNCSITSEVVTVSGSQLSVNITNSVSVFSFPDNISVSRGASYVVATDLACLETIPSKTVDLQVGDNYFYVLVTNEDKSQLYTVTIRRLPLCNVSFDSNGGESIESQTIDEGTLATRPQDPTRIGYTFVGWSHDFSNPITTDTVITASWEANQNTPYKVEYYLESQYGYSLYETLNLTGTTDTTVTAEQKVFEHFTQNSTVSGTKLSGNVDGDGSLVLKVYYTVSYYSVSYNSAAGTVTGGTSHRYGTEVSLTASEPNIGYEFVGWYNGDTLLSEEYSYSCEISCDITAKYTVTEEMELFNFTSTATTCVITGVKDKTVTEIVVPDYVTGVAYAAFGECTRLESLTVPFVGTSKNPSGSREGSLYYTFGWTTEAVPATLGSVIITGSTKIVHGAFYGCTGITSVVIPDGVTTIYSSAFEGCTSLESINIPSSITSIGLEAFEGCTSLKAVYITDLASWCNIQFNNTCNPLSNGADLYLNGELVTELAIPDSITSIGNYAFYGCTSFKSVVIPESVTKIESNAFGKCTNLESITIPFVGATKDGTVNTHFGYIFGASSYEFNSSYVPSSLRSVTITGGTTIKAWAFGRCMSLTSITIPSSITSIESMAFYECFKLVEVYNLSRLNITKGTQDNGYVGYYALDVYTSASAESKLRTDTNGYIFYEDGDTCYLVGYTGTETDITLPETYNGKNYTILDCAFFGCTGLTSVVVPDSVTAVGYSAFKNCTSLESITLPFVGATKEGTENTRFGYIFGPKDISGNNNIIPASLKSITITGGTAIAEEAFWGCVEVSDIKIPLGIVTIGKDAFLCCENLESIEIPSTVTSIGDSAFQLCKSLTSIEIPSSVTEIGYEAFASCISLTSVTFEENSQLDIISNSVFLNCTKLTSIEIPGSVITIEAHAFEKCTSLKSITIPSSVTSIGACAFEKCTGLTSVTFEENSQLMIIDYNAFYGCYSLRSIEIPSNVIEIGSRAFDGCTSLFSVTFAEPSGWRGGMSYSSASLANTSTAATFLRSTYCTFTWYRSE